MKFGSDPRAHTQQDDQSNGSRHLGPPLPSGQARYEDAPAVLRLIGEAALFDDSWRRSRPAEPALDALSGLLRELLGDVTRAELDDLVDLCAEWDQRLAAAALEYTRNPHGSLLEAGRLAVEAEVHARMYECLRRDLSPEDESAIVRTLALSLIGEAGDETDPAIPLNGSMVASTRRSR